MSRACTGPDHRRLESRRVRCGDVDAPTAARILFMAGAADVRVWRFPDGCWQFASDSGNVNSLTSDLDTVNTKQFWPQSLEKMT